MKSLDHNGFAWVVRNAAGKYLTPRNGWTDEIDLARTFGSRGHVKLALHSLARYRKIAAGQEFEIVPCSLVPTSHAAVEQYVQPSGR